MDLQWQIGQHFVCGFPGTEIPDEFRRAVETYQISNVVLFARNIANKNQVARLCRDIQTLVRTACGTPALICVDQEGGMVTRLSEDCTNVPGAMAIAATGDPESARIAGTITAHELRALGFTCDLAPALDVNSNKNNPVIGVRSYGDKAETVITYGTAMMEALQEGGLMSVAKHFPGHGDTRVDSHLDLPIIDSTLEALEIHLAPFRAAIKKGVQGVMSSHILFPAYEKEHLPATMSRAILTELLKDELGFTGLVFSDCMEMKAIKDHYGTEEGSLLAVQAGVDLVCISHHVDLALRASSLIAGALESRAIDRAEFSRSTEKILAAKQRLSSQEPVNFSVVGSEEHRIASRHLLEKGICLVAGTLPPLGAKPLFIGPECFRATNASNAEQAVVFAPEMVSRLGGKAVVCSDNPDEAEIAQTVSQNRDSSSVVMGTYNGHLNTGQIDLVSAFARDSREAHRPVICIALRNPYDLALVPESVVTIAAFEYTRSCFDVLSLVLAGKMTPTGVLPVRL